MIEIKTEQDIAHYKISTRLLMSEALLKGYTLTYFPSSPSTMSGITRCVKDDKEFFFKSTQGASTPSYGVFAAENKVLTHSLLSMNGVLVPDTFVISATNDMESAYSFLNTHRKVVVKPVDTNHGDGISVGVETVDRLERAIAYARLATNDVQADVIIQQQVIGDEYRFLVVDGKVIAVASRRPPYVIGNGSSTIEQLIGEKNLDPRRGDGHTSELTKISIDDVIQHRGHDFIASIPADEEAITVLDTSNLSRGGESIDFTDIASPTIKKLAINAAKYTFLGIAGVDIMTEDVTSNDLGKSYVIEVNLTPGTRMHEFPAEGKSRRVTKNIFESFEKNARPVHGKVIQIGRSENIGLPENNIKKVPARIDTGATITSIWASSIEENDQGLTFIFFDTESEYYTGEKVTVSEYSKRAVASSMGHTQIRFTVTLLVVLHGRRIRAKLTLADRSTQIYPILVGRNVLKNKFIVNVAAGKPLVRKEKARRNELESFVEGENVL